MNQGKHGGCYVCGGGGGGTLVSRSAVDLDVGALSAATGKAPDHLVGLALCGDCNSRFERKGGHK